MGQETKDLGGITALTRRAGSPYFGAEAVNLAVTDAAPTLLMPDGLTPRQPRAIYVGVTGDITVDMADGSASALVLKSVLGGQVLNVAVSKIYKVGTVATNLVFLY